MKRSVQKSEANSFSRTAGIGFFFGWALFAQSTQGLISGVLQDSQSGRRVSAATVTYVRVETNAAGATKSDFSGFYSLPLLSPGLYRIRVTAPGYQSQEVHELELRVAGRIDLSFRLRPLNDVWEEGQYRSVFLPGAKTVVTFYGPDIDTSRSGSFEAQGGHAGPLESTVSQVIDPAQLSDLPLAGRDAYTLLVTQPAVTDDLGTTRGLGLSIGGQRPSSSNFLLDGLENNNYLVTGPLTTVAPEAIQEYRVSTSNFSAEYGGTAGFLANAITRSGSSQLHGVVYVYLKNEALNANDFQRNLAGRPRAPAKETQPGFQTGGPIRRERFFFSTAFEHLRSRGQQDPVTFTLPSTAFLNSFVQASSTAGQLLSRFPPPAVTDRNLLTAAYTISPPVSVDRNLALERFDANSRDGAHRLMARVLIARLSRPDFIWSPYKDFVSGLRQNTAGAALNYYLQFRPGLMNEARAGYSNDDLRWERAHPEIPTLTSSDNTYLPGSAAFYAYKNRNQTWESLDNLVSTRGRRLVIVGAGLLLRSSGGFQTAGQDGQYIFDNIASFALDRPHFLVAALDRSKLPALQQPDFERDYHYRQFSWFAQETFRVSERFTLNYGVRYERYGAPRNVGRVKDMTLELGAGATLAQLSAARLMVPGQGDQELFHTDKGGWGPRFGFSWNPRATGAIVLRGGYGVFYDRPFDNLWQNLRNNNIVLPVLTEPSGRVNYLAPIATLLPAFSGQVTAAAFPAITFFEPGLRNPYVQRYFLGILQTVPGNLQFEVNGMGALGRRLLTTDVVNREFTTATPPSGRLNESLPDIAYRGNQGSSSYHALTTSVRYRTDRAQMQLAYTWSHSIDNQSDPLVGDFFSLDFTRISSADPRSARAQFSRQFDSSVDRGNSDFDQRHNLVFYSLWNVPFPDIGTRFGWLLAGWKFSQLAALRSGFPFSVRATSQATPGGGSIGNQRADITDPAQTVFSNPRAVNGGQQLLNPAGFAQPGVSQIGNSGRNAFMGPGVYNLDVSVSRSVPVQRLGFGENARLAVRADAFNILNHTNLNNPDNRLGSPTFGVATYGRQGRASGFPAVIPLNETARQVQLSLRLQF